MNGTGNHNFLRFLRYVAPYKRYVILAVIGGIVKFTVPLLVPQVTQTLLDDVFLNEALSTNDKLRALWTQAGGLMLIFIIIWTPFTFMRHYYSGKAGQKSVFDLRCDLYYRILRMSASFFTRNKSGGIVSRLISDIQLVQNLVGTALTNIWMDLSALVVILFFLFRIDWQITLVALATFPFYLYVFRMFQSRIRRSTYQVQEEISIMSGNAQEKIAGSTVVRAFTQEKHEEKSFFQDSEHLFNSEMQRIRYQSTSTATTGLLTRLAPLIVLLYGGYSVISGRLSIGELVAVTMYLTPLYLPLERFTELNVVLANSLAALDRIFEIIDEKPEITDKKDAKPLTNVSGNVHFNNVSFRYDPHSPEVLNNISFTAQAGQKIALVGPSGSGKSTIISLIARFYDPTQGTISIDQQPLTNLKQKSLRQNIGMVLQSPILFSGTIRENILYGKPKATETEIKNACKAANALEFIAALPDGFDSQVGEGGALLSGGQRQRITIARAFLKDPKILILDEATSALDSESERLIQSALERLMEGRTTFIIAHRLSTIVGADKIIVMQNGRIVDTGTHKELLNRDGLYRNLYEEVAA